MTRRPTLTLTLSRILLEHPRALHLKRMRSAVWLYLVLVSRLPSGQDTLEFDCESLASTMGLPATTVGTWLGHLKKGRYLSVLDRDHGTFTVRIKRVQLEPQPAEKTVPRFTVPGLERALGETGYRERLSAALDSHPPPVIGYALDRATDVPRSKIRRSRTALFLYLLNHDQTNQTNDSRH